MQKEKAKVHILTEADFSKAINEKKSLVIVDFYADWCGPCQIMAPIIESLAKDNPQVKFGKINVDNAPNVSIKYEVSGIPCIIFFKQGKEIDRIVGVADNRVFEDKIKNYS